VWTRASLPGFIKPVLSSARDAHGNFYLGIDGGLLKSTSDGLSWVFLENSGNWTPAKLAVANNDILYGVYGYKGSFLGYFDENILRWFAFPVGIYIGPYYSTLAYCSNGVIFGLSTVHGLLKIIDNTSNLLEDDIISASFFLSQNYPNPFNPSTTIEYSIPSTGTERISSLNHVTLKVYDLLGREAATLVDGEKSLGNYKVEWKSFSLPSGVY